MISHADGSTNRLNSEYKFVNVYMRARAHVRVSAYVERHALTLGANIVVHISCVHLDQHRPPCSCVSTEQSIAHTYVNGKTVLNTIMHRTHGITHAPACLKHSTEQTWAFRGGAAQPPTRTQSSARARMYAR